MPLRRARGTVPAQNRLGARVPLILATRTNTYTGSPLDRATHRRDDAGWIAAALDDPRSLFVPVWRSRSLMRGVEERRPEAVYLTGEAAAVFRMAGGPWAFLGLLDQAAVFAVDVSDVEDPLPLLPAALGVFEDLRGGVGVGGFVACDADTDGEDGLRCVGGVGDGEWFDCVSEMVRGDDGSVEGFVGAEDDEFFSAVAVGGVAGA